jgi:hypothetical protein
MVLAMFALVSVIGGVDPIIDGECDSVGVIRAHAIELRLAFAIDVAVGALNVRDVVETLIKRIVSISGHGLLLFSIAEKRLRCCIETLTKLTPCRRLQ